jgi:hypothetical protein
MRPGPPRICCGQAMGCHTYIYAVDLRRVQSAFGSNDRDLLRRIAGKYPDDCAASNNSFATFATFVADGVLSLDGAVAELIQGTLSSPASSAFQYGYALEMLCLNLGAKLDTDRLGKIAGIGFAEQLATSGPPIPIPTPDDFPIIGYMTHQQAEAELQRIAGLDLSHPNAFVNLAIAQLRACLEQARRQTIDLVAFCY